MKRKSWFSRLAYLVLALALLGVVGYAFLPAPVTVEVHTVTRGDVEVTVDDDGKTRIKEKYVVSSPLAGRLARVQLHPGDPVEAGKTVLTTLDPVAPSLLDVRSRTEAEARVKAAELTVKRTEPILTLAREKLTFAKEEFDRAKLLYERSSIAHEERDRVENRWITQAALIYVQRATADELSSPEDWRIEIPSPISGQILRVLQESAAVVTAGMPLMEVGDPSDLEVVIDALSNDAVKIAPGNRVRLEDWGGAKPLNAHVRYVEPSGFTKISALGIEEQRVNVIIDFDDPPEERAGLADDFRVDARIIVANVRDVLKTPNAALFRRGEATCVFVVERGIANVREVTLGRQGKLESEVTRGLREGDSVIVYPSDKVKPGVRVTPALESRW